MKKLNEFGYGALDKMDKCMEDRMGGGENRDLLYDIAKGGNMTARVMDSTLRVEKHNVALKLAKQ